MRQWEMKQKVWGVAKRKANELDSMTTIEASKKKKEKRFQPKGGG